jgi:hypothetical protein
VGVDAPPSKAVSKPRTLPHSHVHPSSLRPHVLAHKRIEEWTTPYAINHFGSLPLPDSSLTKWRSVMLASVTNRSLKNYRAGVLRFNQWCDSHSIAEHLRMPAAEELLCIFAAEMGAGRVSSSTVNSWLCGIAFWNQANAAPWHGHSLLTRTKKGVHAISARLIPACPPRLPVTVEHMRALKKHLVLSDMTRRP